MKIAATAIVVAALAVGSAGAATTRDVGAVGPVVALATTATEVAYVARIRPRCFELRVWNTADRGVRRYASHCFASTSTGSGVGAVAVAGGRALWLTYTGGNIREWSLWTKSRTSRVKRLRFVARDVDAPAPLVLGSAWEGSLPYALHRTIVVLAPNGARLFTLTAPDRVVSLSAHTRGYAAVLADGRALSISRTGTLLRERPFVPGFVEAAVLAGPGLIVKTRNGLQITSGHQQREISLPPGSRFHGFSEGVVAYSRGDALRLLRLRDAKHMRFRTLAPAFQAHLGRRGLGHATGSRVSFAAWENVVATLAR